ncbi:hypothetical protein ILUMI_04155 [Ignelater luminosus]|uniref:Uncharacterized protein n=1 Tax=Ignelater luminosus TaxID=2038154 RepID=A0A8K0DF98_IGNLU|nr:hypothetical protein ILUMI_04155 [Ignelater luminosus]
MVSELCAGPSRKRFRRKYDSYCCLDQQKVQDIKGILKGNNLNLDTDDDEPYTDSLGEYLLSEEDRDQDNGDSGIHKNIEEERHETSVDDAGEKDDSKIIIRWTANQFIPQIYSFDVKQQCFKETLSEINYLFNLFTEDVAQNMVLEYYSYATQQQETKWKELDLYE